MGALQDISGSAGIATGTVVVEVEVDDLPSTNPLTSFTRFPDLPTELRLKIWQLSFVPRVVEVHRRKSHYADGDRSSASAKWQSWSSNPPALAVCYESRTLALEHYAANIRLAVNTPCERAGEARLDLHRRLYLAPHVDTLVVLGEFHVAQTVELLRHIWGQARAQPHNEGRGLRRLALSASSIGHPGSGILLLIYSKNIFQDLDALTLVMYAERTPPTTWRDGHMALVDCREDSYQYRYFRAGQGAELRDNRAVAGGGNGASDTRGWMKVGHGPLQVLDLAFGHEAEAAAEAAAKQASMLSVAEKRILQPVVETTLMVRPRSLAGADMNDEVPWISMGP
ncbi:hypothetical protein SEUCBS139899_006634 [Sporothrix eucalyptigena]|uniref:2EXR domain-containing protein n=1 Tax=Sporothrix eucalyptigena TaxID=1812306 RepID=A0ABP0B251_9PEZI